MRRGSSTGAGAEQNAAPKTSDRSDVFIFSEKFLDLVHLPLDQMFQGFNTLAQQQQQDPNDIDDITLVGLEVH